MKERKRQVGESENTSKMFLLSLLDKVTNISLNVIDEIMTASRVSIVTMASLPYSNSSQLSFPFNNNQTDTYSRERQIATISFVACTVQDLFPLYRC